MRTGKLSGTFDHEPKSAEEIITLLKIDTEVNGSYLSIGINKWETHWRVSALISQVKNSQKQKLFEDLLEK